VNAVINPREFGRREISNRNANYRPYQAESLIIQAHGEMPVKELRLQVCAV
jgi:hypothetical protein